MCNILFFVIDTLRYDCVAEKKPPGLKTPAFDRLRERSITFEHAYTNSYPTIPCRKDMVYGTYGDPFNRWHPMDINKRTFPRVLFENGYCTQLIHDTPHLVNGGMAFDYFFNAWTFLRGAEVDRPIITKKWTFPDNWAPDPAYDAWGKADESLIERGHYMATYLQSNAHRKNEGDWNCRRLFDAASLFLEDNAGRDNFFLWVDCFDPHEPWDSPEEYVKMYLPEGNGKIDPRLLFGGVGSGDTMTEEIKRVKRALYMAKLSFVDRQLGKVLDTLERTGLAENTVVVLTADHGTNLADRPGLGFGKRRLPQQYEARIPLLISAPWLKPHVRKDITAPQDIYATILGLAGVECNMSSSQDLLKGPSKREYAVTAWGPIDVGKDTAPQQQLFSVLNCEWCLSVAADNASCALYAIGGNDEVAAANPGVVAELKEAGIALLVERGMPGDVAAWLRGGGVGFAPEWPAPTDYLSRGFGGTEYAHSYEGWREYWCRNYLREPKKTMN
ncbi:MAG: sulfatase [Oscillospiraceae bacterium]|nr:sulfatase [Oscillospiraceae bacterium]